MSREVKEGCTSQLPILGCPKTEQCSLYFDGRKVQRFLCKTLLNSLGLLRRRCEVYPKHKLHVNPSSEPSNTKKQSLTVECLVRAARTEHPSPGPWTVHEATCRQRFIVNPTNGNKISVPSVAPPTNGAHSDRIVFVCCGPLSRRSLRRRHYRTSVGAGAVTTHAQWTNSSLGPRTVACCLCDS
ncbi:hypothetical protein J6590_005474 [Homalodisca vitripennis]|nr:hypothetical protein J6590_005474 [Homalodisca vitripennis]